LTCAVDADLGIDQKTVSKKPAVSAGLVGGKTTPEEMRPSQTPAKAIARVGHGRERNQSKNHTNNYNPANEAAPVGNRL
jgi:hypothetical protein